MTPETRQFFETELPAFRQACLATGERLAKVQQGVVGLWLGCIAITTAAVFAPLTRR